MAVSPINSTTTLSNITITLLLHSDNSRHRFTVSPQLRIEDLLTQILGELAQGTQAERMRQLRENYKPVLELLTGGESRALNHTQTLSEAGVSENAICQIAARPIKEKLLFCRYTNQA